MDFVLKPSWIVPVKMENKPQIRNQTSQMSVLIDRSSSATKIQRWWKKHHLCDWCRVEIGYEDLKGMCWRCHHVYKYWDVIACEHGNINVCC